MYFAMMNQLLLNLYPHENKYKLVTDIASRVASSDEIRANLFLYEYYDVQDGETPDIIADKVYNDSNLHWVVMMCNDIIDPVYDWPMSQEMLLAMVIDTYGEANIYNTHHHEDGKGNWVSDDYPLATFITNMAYEEEMNESKRRIKLLQPLYLADFVNEVETKLKSQRL